jgi:regulator of replication initiation timing
MTTHTHTNREFKAPWIVAYHVSIFAPNSVSISGTIQGFNWLRIPQVNISPPGHVHRLDTGPDSDFLTLISISFQLDFIQGDETEGAPRSSLEGEADMSMCSRESSPAISETSTAASAQSSAAADAGLRAENEELRARISEEISAAAAQREALEKERCDCRRARSRRRDRTYPCIFRCFRFLIHISFPDVSCSLHHHFASLVPPSLSITCQRSTNPFENAHPCIPNSETVNCGPNRDELMAALSSERDEIARVGAQAIGESEGRIAELEGRISELEVALEEAKSSGVAAAAGKDAEIASQAKLLGDRDAEITDKDAEIERIGQVLAEKEASLSEKDAALAAAVGERDAEVEKASQNLAERDATLAERDAEIASQTKLLAERDAEISSIRAALSAGESALEKAMSDKAELASEKASLQARLNEAEESLARAQSMLEQVISPSTSSSPRSIHKSRIRNRAETMHGLLAALTQE